MQENHVDYCKKKLIPIQMNNGNWKCPLCDFKGGSGHGMTKNNALLHILESKKHEADVNNKDDSVQEKKVGKVKTGNVDLTKKRMIQHLSEQENEKRKKTESNPEPTVIVINDDAEEDEPPKSTGNGRKGKKNFTRAQKVQILKHVVAVKNKLMVDGHEEGEALTRAYNFTAEHFKKELERETFTAMSIRNWTNPKRSHCKTIEEYITRLENLKKNLNAESKEIEGKILHVGRADRTAYEKNTQRTADYPEMEQMLVRTNIHLIHSFVSEHFSTHRWPCDGLSLSITVQMV